MDETLYLREKMLLVEYKDIVAKEEFFCCQKCRETWPNVGDKNTIFFHNSSKKGRTINRITKIKYDYGVSTEDPIQIVAEAVSYFENILNN